MFFIYILTDWKWGLCYKLGDIMDRRFKVVSEYEPRGDQPQAIKELLGYINKGQRYTILKGVTGSGKTYTIAKMIEQLNRPCLVISHNKTLAAQLFGEFKTFYPENNVEYFISYYDYYQPEAYIPSSDTYIEKDADVNEHIDRLRLRATSTLMDKRDVIIVASVSCIYGLGNPKDYRAMTIAVNKEEGPKRDDLIRMLADIFYKRNPVDFSEGSFRVRGDVVEIFPPYAEFPFRIDYFGDSPEEISEFNPITGEVIKTMDSLSIYSTKHFVSTPERLKNAVMRIRQELAQRLKELRDNNMLVAAERLETRTNYDIELMLELGYCSGIENYSRHIAGREEGERPDVLLDYFPDDFVCIIDESHVTVPQLKAMYRGDRSRKETLVEHGFRLPSALDNRPLYFEEFLSKAKQIVFVTATPGDWEKDVSGNAVVELINRPTGLVDPEMIVKPTRGQIEDLLGEIRERIEKNERVLVTTLTKKMSEQLADYLSGYNVRSRYLHSEITSIERVEILRDLRLGNFDVLVGVNLLREGLDLPEVSLVAIMDADKEGFLRSYRSLIQVSGRAARHISGKVILYADRITNSMELAMKETNNRRSVQLEFNKKHNIIPKTIHKTVDDIMKTTGIVGSKKSEDVISDYHTPGYLKQLPEESKIEELMRLMKQASKELNFEYAAFLRDEIKEIEKKLPTQAITKSRRKPKFNRFDR